MRQIRFDFVCDDRFGKNKNDLIEMDKQLKIRLAKLEGVYLEETSIRRLIFGDPEPSISWRKTYIISKKGRNPTWNDIFAVINPIYAPYYKFI